MNAIIKKMTLCLVLSISFTFTTCYSSTQRTATFSTNRAIGHDITNLFASKKITTHAACWNTDSSPTISHYKTNEGSSSSVESICSSMEEAYRYCTLSILYSFIDFATDSQSITFGNIH